MNYQDQDDSIGTQTSQTSRIRCFNSTHLNSMMIENLPRLVLSQILSFLPHSSRINLSLSSKNLHKLVMMEWDNPSLWRHITISPNLTHPGYLSLIKALLGTKMRVKNIQSLKISNSEEFLSNFSWYVVCVFWCFHRLSTIVIEAKIIPSRISQILSLFNKTCNKCKLTGGSLQSVKLSKQNLLVTKLSDY